jgi:hypothetical protein
MAILGFDDLALMLFDFGRGGLENLHIDNVVTSIRGVESRRIYSTLARAKNRRESPTLRQKDLSR